MMNVNQSIVRWFIQDRLKEDICCSRCFSYRTWYVHICCQSCNVCADHISLLMYRGVFVLLLHTSMCSFSMCHVAQTLIREDSCNLTVQFSKCWECHLVCYHPYCELEKTLRKKWQCEGTCRSTH